MKFIISDLHGCYDTLIALLKKLPSEANNTNIIFVGDLVDRGSDSRKIINFIRDGGYDVVLGNHEELMIEAVSNYINHNIEVGDDRMWMQNGGRATLLNYQDSYGTDYDSLIEDVEWLSNLPKYKIYRDEVDDKGRVLVVTHAVSIDFFENNYLGLFDNLDELLIWNRTIPEKGSKVFFNISGHNIIDNFIFDEMNELKVKKENVTPEHILVDKELGYACIDTGAFSKIDHHGNLNCSEIDKINENPYRGRMTCISFPELNVIQQCNIERLDWR